jgi:hypothetical protein
MYTFVDFTSESLGGGGSLVPQTRGSHTPIWCAGLAVTLKIDYYYYYYYYQFRDLKNRLLLLLLLLLSVLKSANQL